MCFFSSATKLASLCCIISAYVWFSFWLSLVQLNCPFVTRYSPAASSLMPKQFIHVPVLLSFLFFPKVSNFLPLLKPEQSYPTESGQLHMYHHCYSLMYGRKLQKEEISEAVLV